MSNSNNSNMKIQKSNSPVCLLDIRRQINQERDGMLKTHIAFERSLNRNEDIKLFDLDKLEKNDKFNEDLIKQHYSYVSDLVEHVVKKVAYFVEKFPEKYSFNVFVEKDIPSVNDKNNRFRFRTMQHGFYDPKNEEFVRRRLNRVRLFEKPVTTAAFLLRKYGIYLEDVTNLNVSSMTVVQVYLYKDENNNVRFS
jgi:hypothetical protein